MAVNRELLEETLDIIRQSLQADGGDVELIDVNDDATDRFDCGARGSGLGSGTYCFEPLPAGPLGVSWDGSFGVTLAWWQTKGGLPWS